MREIDSLNFRPVEVELRADGMILVPDAYYEISSDTIGLCNDNIETVVHELCERDMIDLLAEILPAPHPALSRRVFLIQNTSANHIMSPFKGGRWGKWRTWGIKPTRMTK